MPELPEVETVCRGLNAVTRHQVIQGGEVLRASTLAYPDSIDAFWDGITGCAIAQWQRRGKYLLAQLQPAGWLGIHLRMSGQLLWVKPDTPLQKHTRLRWFFSQEQELRFVDTRTFGRVWWIPPDTDPEEIMTGLQKLGVEPFSPDFTIPYFTQKLQKTQRPIKTVLLDQSMVAGLGNIYADETLFLSQIHPTTPASTLTPTQIQRLHQSIRKVLQTAIDQGGTTFSSFLSVMGVNGNYMGQAWVYGRTGGDCRLCETPIERIKLGGRSTHFCPQCQGDSSD